MVIQRPGQYERDRAEETRSRGVYCCVTVDRGGAKIAEEGEEEVTESGQEGVEDDVWGAGAGAVRKLGSHEDENKG